MENQKSNPKKKVDQKKTVYKETKESINEKELDSGETSSVVDLGRTDLISRPKRKNRPLGSSHEPGTTPGGDI
ncbi:hypothetical protein D3C87_2025500 [compost metagenome]